MLLHVMRVHFATLSFAFVVNREIVLVWGIILGNVFDSFYKNYSTFSNQNNLTSSVQHNFVFLQRRN
jgi:hypothetical protein